MWVYIVRRLLYNVPVYLGIILLMMAALRVNDPVWAKLGKRATQEQYDAYAARVGLDKPFVVQYVSFLGDIVTLNFDAESWDQSGHTAGEMLARSIIPSLSLTVPALLLTSFLSICIGIIASFFRGRGVDRTLMILAVLGMSVSFLVYIILGQYFGAFWLNQQIPGKVFAVSGYQPGLPNWAHYCLLPVLISVIVAMGYDTRFYRAVMVEESDRDYIVTAKAKGATKRKIMFAHMLKNAMIPIISRIMITMPFLVTGSILLESYFNIPGMGKTLLTAINSKDFPVVEVFTAGFAAIFIITNILTDVLYALVDPRVRLS
jgi:peptide/nickel transport system permease protein